VRREYVRDWDREIMKTGLACHYLEMIAGDGENVVDIFEGAFVVDEASGTSGERGQIQWSKL